MLNSTGSLPSWERGLKYPGDSIEYTRVPVAPFVGAWIEIILIGKCIFVPLSRSLRGSVDWNCKSATVCQQ